jgi:chemotaxis-related protein WspD
MEAEPGSTLQVVVFRLGENRLAIPTSALKRIDTVPRIHRIPHCGSRLLGMAMADGDLHLCADLSAVLGLGPGGAPGEASRLLIVERESEAWAFIADEAAQMASWDPGHKTAPPPGPAAEYASGAWDHDGRRVLLLDEELLFGALQRCLK